MSNTELSEFVGPLRVLGRELSEFLSAYYLCEKENLPSFSQNSLGLPQNSVRLTEFSSPKQSETFAIGSVQFSWPRGAAENRFTKPGFWEHFVSFS